MSLSGSEIGSDFGSISGSVSGNGSGSNNDIGSINGIKNNESTTSTEEQIEKLQAEVQILKKIVAETQELDEEAEEYLSDREKKLLTQMNSMSNKITEQSAFVKDIMNKPVMEIVHNWSATHQDILHDTADLVTKSNLIENIKNNDKWWVPIGDFFKQFINIITSGERMFYVGMTVLFIGLIFVFVNITEGSPNTTTPSINLNTNNGLF